MVNKQERTLTWKYFFQQKFNEVLGFLIIGAVIIFIPFLLGNIIGDNRDIICGESVYSVEDCSVVLQWFEGVAYILFAIVVAASVAFLLYLMYLAFYEWIESNWKKAEKRAKAQVRKTKRDAKRGKQE